MDEDLVFVESGPSMCVISSSSKESQPDTFTSHKRDIRTLAENGNTTALKPHEVDCSGMSNYGTHSTVLHAASDTGKCLYSMTDSLKDRSYDAGEFQPAIQNDQRAESKTKEGELTRDDLNPEFPLTRRYLGSEQSGSVVPMNQRLADRSIRPCPLPPLPPPPPPVR